MSKKITFNILLSLLLFVAVLSGAYAAYVEFPPATVPAISEIDFFDSVTTPASSPPITIEIQAFVRSDSPLKPDDVEWIFNLSPSIDCDDFRCSLIPQGAIENLECSNPDGTTHFVAILNAVVLVHKPVKTLKSGLIQASSSSQNPFRLWNPKRSKTDKPAIVLTAHLAAKKLNVTWSTVNIPDGDCKLLFKLKKDSELFTSQDFC